jgi:hypothetical protein
MSEGKALARRKTNLVLPSQIVVANSPVHRLVKTQVTLDPDQAHSLSPKNKQGKPDEVLIPARHQLQEIAYAAGIDFRESRELESPAENVITWQVTGEIENALGDKQRDQATYRLDTRYKERDGVDGDFMARSLSDRMKRRDILLSNPKWKNPWEPDPNNAEAWQAYTRAEALKEIKQVDRFKVQRAETGAKLRLIRSFCNLRHSYKREELERPFEVIRATIDISLAMRMGGQFQDVALQLMGAAMARQLGLPQEAALQIADGVSKNVEGTDDTIIGKFVRLTSEEVEELEAEMAEAGFKDREACEEKAESLFGVNLESLTQHHAELIREQIYLVAVAKETLKKEELKEFVPHMNEVTQLAVAEEGAAIRDMIDEEYYYKLFPEAAEMQDTIEGEVVGPETDGEEEEEQKEPEEEEDAS